MANCGELSYAQKTQIEAIAFWATNSAQHIQVLLVSPQSVGAILYPSYNRKLESLAQDFQRIANEIECTYPRNDRRLTAEFLQKNSEFICLLQRLKFEGYNGFPTLYQAVLHFIYVAEYANDIIQAVRPRATYGEPSVLYQMQMRRKGVGNTPLECCYGQMYFWSIVGAQHPSILMTVTPDEEAALPKTTRDGFTYFINRFNSINYELSNKYPKLNRKDLREINSVYLETYREFLNFLLCFKGDDALLPYSLRKCLPRIFFELLDQIIHEAKDALIIGEKIGCYLG